MSLSANIKRLRLEKNLTQEQLASKLGVSAQAVSKWETSETYPDGALLVPLANELDVSLDEFFGNESVTMSDISSKIIKLIYNTEETERFNEVCLTVVWRLKTSMIQMKLKPKSFHHIFLTIMDLQSYLTEICLSSRYFHNRPMAMVRF